jgi:AbiJ N-terminal domain 4
MLTDIFAYRYLNTPLWDDFDENSRRLLAQGFRIVSEQLFPYYSDGKERAGAKEKWDGLNKQLAMELGLKDLSATAYGYYNPQNIWIGGNYPKVMVCENFVCAQYDHTVSADQFIKERLSFIEIAFRLRNSEIAKINASLPEKLLQAKKESAMPSRGIRLPGNREDGVRAANEAVNTSFRSSCAELNERFRQARTKLDYHNGFIQIVGDEKVEEQIETPFWALIADSKWQNVDIDMKEAIDHRDAAGRDPAWYAARALESTIKIISDEKGWTHGGEKGAHSYIDNIVSKKNGQFIDTWECNSLKRFFSDVRADFGHGPGSDPMPELTPQQTDWAIEFCMSWIKSLIQRI